MTNPADQMHNMQDVVPPQEPQQQQQPTKKRRKNRGGCYHCGSKDHRARDCPAATCQICGCRGHAVGGCPRKDPPPVHRGRFHGTDNKNDKPIRFTFVELFAGIGGFRVALEHDKIGGRCVFASEVDRFCVANYQLNFQGDCPAGDITRIPTEWIPPHDVLVGGFPCQPFSSSGKQQGLQDEQRGQLFREIVRILQAKKPKAFLLENVRGLYLHDQGKTLQIIQQELGACGYDVQSKLLDAVHLLPQERCRLFIVGIRRDLHLQNDKKKFQFPKLPNPHRGVEDILQDDELTHSDLEALLLSPHQLAKVKAQKYTQEHPEARFLRDTTQPAKTLQSSYTKYMVGSQFVPAYSSSLDRNDQDTDNDNPQQQQQWRRFSSREAARLQGFPESFQLCRERPYHMLGNAVAPPLIALIAAPLLQHIGVVWNNNNDSTFEDDRASSSSVLPGWEIAKEMLLEASPNDGRRDKLREKLDNVDFAAVEG